MSEAAVERWSVRREGAVAIATYEFRPRNLITWAGMTAFEAIVEEIAADGGISVFVIESAVPGYFISHADLIGLVQLGRGEPCEGDPSSWGRVLPRLASMPQIVIAAIDGQAGGGGAELSLACTLRVAGPRACFVFPEVPLGLIPGGGGTQRLSRLIGAGRAAEIILSGRVVHAAEAERLGIVEALLTEEPFAPAAIAWAQRIARRPPESLRRAKRAILDGLELGLEAGLELEAGHVGPLVADPATLAIEEAAIARYAAAPPDEPVVF